MSKQIAIQALAMKVLQEKMRPQRESLIEFIKYMYPVYKAGQVIKIPKFYYDIERKLMEVLEGKCTRLRINIPPRSGKTMFITQMFPIWAMGRDHSLEFMSAGHSTNLTRSFSQVARDLYQSPEFRRVFPEAPLIRDDLNTSEWWKNTDGGGYNAAGITSKFSGKGCDIFILDDIVDPQDAAYSEVKLAYGNSWYGNTVEHRLNDGELIDGTKRVGVIIIVMQRTHDNDLCGFLETEEIEGKGQWDEIIVPSLEWDDAGSPQTFFPDRSKFTVENLLKLQLKDPVAFSTQYQQEPTNKEAQEFHEEYWRYYTELPKTNYKQYFAMLDPAFREGKENDRSVIHVCSILGGKFHLEEIIGGRFTTYQTEDKCVYIARKYDLDKFWIEDYGAQVTMLNNVDRRFKKEGIYTPVEGFNQKGTKKTEKIRSIISPIRNGLILFKKDIPLLDLLENEMKRFPRGKHDDFVDCLQMLFNAVNLQPEDNEDYSIEEDLQFDEFGRPVF